MPSDSGKRCAVDADCSTGSICFANVCVGQGALRFSLSWEVDTDFDLHIITPNDVELSFGNPFDDGGILDLDDCVGSLCRDPAGTHVENIFFISPATGTYIYWADNYSEEVQGRFDLEVAADGRVVATQGGTLTVAPPGESARYMFAY